MVDSSGPIRLVLVGAGTMGCAWISTLTAAADVELVGVVDLDLDLAKQAAAEHRLDDVVFGTSASEVAFTAHASAVVNVTVPRAHRAVNEECLREGLPVLCEKPIAPTLTEALSQAALAELTGELLMVSQSRRYSSNLTLFRRAIADQGRLGVLTTEFFKASHFGGFREVMAHPLLIDMAIHQFDAARYLSRADPVSVTCSSWNPAWSWYRGDAAATAEFELERGIRYVYTGSWCAPGLETSWNGSWRASADMGSTTWDGEGRPVTTDGARPIEVSGPGEGIAGSLTAFVRALRTGVVPSGEIHLNIPTLAMVAAAVRSADSGRRVVIADLLDDALEEARRVESAADVRSQLLTWNSAA